MKSVRRLEEIWQTLKTSCNEYFKIFTVDNRVNGFTF